MRRARCTRLEGSSNNARDKTAVLTFHPKYTLYHCFYLAETTPNKPGFPHSPCPLPLPVKSYFTFDSRQLGRGSPQVDFIRNLRQVSRTIKAQLHLTNVNGVRKCEDRVDAPW
jgi:hypothetical protein